MPSDSRAWVGDVMSAAARKRFSWPTVLRMAEEEVARIQHGLPAPLRRQAHSVPVCFVERPSRAQLEDGVGEDLLGLFVGVPFPESDNGMLDIPPQIYLFLHNLWEDVEGDEELLREEIATTYLHELGHYLGLDEDDLFDRELD